MLLWVVGGYHFGRGLGCCLMVVIVVVDTLAWVAVVVVVVDLGVELYLG